MSDKLYCKSRDILQGFVDKLPVFLCLRIAIIILSSFSMRMSSLTFRISRESCAWNYLKAVVDRVIQRNLVELYVTRIHRGIMFGRETSNR